MRITNDDAQAPFKMVPSSSVENFTTRVGRIFSWGMEKSEDSLGLST